MQLFLEKSFFYKLKSPAPQSAGDFRLSKKGIRLANCIKWHKTSRFPAMEWPGGVCEEGVLPAAAGAFWASLVRAGRGKAGFRPLRWATQGSALGNRNFSRKIE